MFRLIAIFVCLPFLLNAQSEEWKGKLEFGNSFSTSEVYIFTDWFCPFCQALEPDLEKMLPKIFEKSRVLFVDLANHPGSMNFLTYNVSFMLHNKADYLKIRPILHHLTSLTKTPTEEQLNQALAPLNIRYKPLPKETVEAIARYFQGIALSFKIRGTPSLTVKNSQTKKEKTLAGDEITEANVLQTLETLQNLP